LLVNVSLLSCSENVLTFLLGSTTVQIFPTFEGVLALNAHLSQKVKCLLAILFFEFAAIQFNGCGELRKFGEVGGSLNLVGDRVLPFLQPAVAQKLSTFVAPVYEHNVDPRLDSLNLILRDFEHLGDRPYGDAEFFRWLDAPK
jgi:hypothetical protein